ncbi:MAG: alpha/beta hydrolase [Planctomycetes bacterium]|nr:alpha/beta hydrolase [Planctomycetota bacterium]
MHEIAKTKARKGIIRRLLKSFLRIVITAYIAIVAVFWLFQSWFIYHPTGEITNTPESMGAKFEEVEFQSADGVRLNGWFIPAEPALPGGAAAANSGATVLYCHGNARNISDCLDIIRILTGLKLNVFVFDYRGFGKSEGKPAEKGLYADAEAAYNYLIKTKGINENEIIVHGRSLGGPMAAYLAQKYNPKKLILESTFTSMADAASDIYPYLPVRLILRHNYPTIEYARLVKCPVLVIHSANDELIPFSHGRRLYESIKTKKEFLEITGLHNNGFLISENAYINGIKEFIDR